MSKTTMTTTAAKPKLFKQSGMRVDPEILARLAEYCSNHYLRPSRDRVIEEALRQFLDNEAEKAKLRQRSAA